MSKTGDSQDTLAVATSFLLEQGIQVKSEDDLEELVQVWVLLPCYFNLHFFTANALNVIVV